MTRHVIRSALAIRFYEAARARWPRALPADYDVGPDLEPGSGNEEGKLQDNGRGLIQIRADYPPPADLIGQQLHDDALEKVVHHGLGHVAQKWLERAGVDILHPYWGFRRFRGTPEIAAVEADAREALAPGSGWSFQPRESWAEFFGAALSGRWIVTLGASQGERTFNDGKPIDALDARAFVTWLIDSSGRAPAEGSQLRPDSSLATWVGGVPIGNYTPGREGNAVALIVDHWTVSSLESAIASFRNPNNPRGRLSSHYIVGQDGQIVQLVPEAATAHHAGIWDANLRSIGIEHEASPLMPPTAALYAASAKLHADIATRHRLELEAGVTVLEHRAIVATDCPGTLDLVRIIEEAGGKDMFTEQDRAMLKRVYDHHEAYEPMVWTKRLQQWLAKAIKSIFPNADITGPDVESGQPFKQ